MHALLLAKDSDEAAILSLVLKRAGLAITPARDLDQAGQIWLENPADLVALALPDLDPLEQVRRIRAETVSPLVILVNLPDEELHFTLLEAGADLVVTRPFSARLLIAQVRVLLRRVGGASMPSLPSLNLGDLTLDPATRTIEVSYRSPQRLTHLEFRLLYTLMLHRGQVLPAEIIVERVWGYGNQGDRELVRGLISRLRAKVEKNPRKPHYILTIPGVGYLLKVDGA